MDVEFTKWLSEEVFKDGLGKSIFRKDCLSEDEVSLLSECWWASRQYMVIELPKWEEYSGDDEGVAHAIFDCAKSIKVVGVKIK